MIPAIEDILIYYPEIDGIHPACLAVPPIGDDDQKELNRSVKESGLRHEIVLTKDRQLLDGRNRLIACYLADIEPRFEIVESDPWELAYIENIAHRHLTTGQRSIFAAERKKHEAIEAKKRMEQGFNQYTERPKEIFPEGSTGQSRDIAGKALGVSGRSVDKAEEIIQSAPDIAEKVKVGAMSLEEGYKETRSREKQKASLPIEKAPKVDDSQFATIVTASGVESKIPLPKKVVFNQTNDSVDWADYTWNPVTGCEHGCKFCYAREIAHSSRMADYYPNKFEPTFHPYRLDAPKNMPKPKDGGGSSGRVFVCSMADLFGKWVPDEWIRSVFDACQDAPEWEYMFLTKWPARYSRMPLLERAWYGSSVIQQSDVARVEKAMQSFRTDCVKWISLEPMLEPIKFNDIEWCDLMVIGAQSSTTQPEDGYIPPFAPEFDWVVDVVNQCREQGVPYYLKANLGVDGPGMKLPKPEPRE